MNEDNLHFESSIELEKFKSLIRKKQFVAILAPQHVGTDALIFKGAIPALKHGGYMAKAGTKWKIATCTPTDSPVMQLAQGLIHPNILYDEQDRITPKFEEEILGYLNSDDFALINIYRRYEYVQGHNLLIVVDQFEKLLSEEVTLSERNQFLRLLLNAVEQSRYGIYVILAIDSEKLEDGLLNCRKAIEQLEKDNPGPQIVKMNKTIDDLEDWISTATYQLHTMNQRMLEQRIREYALKEGGIDIDDNKCLKLVEKLYSIQFQMNMIPDLLEEKDWRFWATEGIKVKRSGKEEKKEKETKDKKRGMSIRQKNAPQSDVDLIGHLNILYNEWDDRQRKICERIYKTIVYKNEKNEITHRATELENISKVIEFASYGEIREVLKLLVDTKVHAALHCSSVSIEPDSMISLENEKLLDWPELAGWIEEEHRLVTTLLEISDSASTYFFNKSVDLWDKSQASDILSFIDANYLNEYWFNLYIYNTEETLRYLRESGKISFNKPTRQPVNMPPGKIRIGRVGAKAKPKPKVNVKPPIIEEKEELVEAKEELTEAEKPIIQEQEPIAHADATEPEQEKIDTTLEENGKAEPDGEEDVINIPEKEEQKKAKSQAVPEKKEKVKLKTKVKNKKEKSKEVTKEEEIEDNAKGGIKIKKRN